MCVEAFNLDVILFVGKFDKKYIKKVMKRNVGKKFLESTFGDEDTSLYDGLCWDYNHIQIIWLDEFNVGTLVHELNHAILNHARYIGMENSEEGDEYFCYMLQYLLNKSLELVGVEYKIKL